MEILVGEVSDGMKLYFMIVFLKIKEVLKIE